jgi:hypothetical protein
MNGGTTATAGLCPKRTIQANMTRPRADVANALPILVNRGLGTMSSKPTPGSVGQNLTFASFSAQRSCVSRDARIDGAYKMAIDRQATTSTRNLNLSRAFSPPTDFGKELAGDAFESRDSLNSLVPHPTQKSAASSFSCPQYAHVFILRSRALTTVVGLRAPPLQESLLLLRNETQVLKGEFLEHLNELAHGIHHDHHGWFESAPGWG